MSSGQNTFDSAKDKQPKQAPELQTRDFDPESAEGELRLRLGDADKRIKKLEEAQIVSPELLSTVISL